MAEVRHKLGPDSSVMQRGTIKRPRMRTGLLERTYGACDTPLSLTFHTMMRGRVVDLHLKDHSSFWRSLALL